MKLSACAFVCFLMLPSISVAQVTLADQGKAIVPILHRPNASVRIVKAAQTLATYLEKIAGAKFTVEAEKSATAAGIHLGLIEDLNEVRILPHWAPAQPTQREDYLIHTSERSVYLIGASDLAVEHAVWDMLYRVGYRQYFPGANWEIIPKTTKLDFHANTREQPSYYSRRIWYGYGAARWSKDAYESWCAKNRCVAGIELNSGHAYPGFYTRNKAEFAKHPEYLSLIKGERRFAQLCISNPGLRQLVVDDALGQFAKNPERHSISVDPNDGGGWCECAECKKLGSISNRAVTLANQVAEEVNKKYPGRYVGMYAYSQHSPPPTIDVHPKVVVSVATGFITGGYTVDQLVQGWQAKKATIGIREYYSVHTWDRDMPGRARGANTAYLRKTIPHFHDMGARFLSAESSDNWGCNGLGYYLAARMLWDVKEAKNVDALIEDFLDKSFGAAKKPMAEFYKLTDAASRPLLTDDLVGRMFRLLAEARGLTKDPAVHARLEDLVLYTHYVDQWLDFGAAKGPEHQSAFEAVVKHVYRMKDRLMVHTLAVGRDVAGRDKSLVMPKEASPYTPEPKNPWMSSKPFAKDEIEQYLADGIARRQLFQFTPVGYSKDLVVPKGLDYGMLPRIEPNLATRGTRHFYTWVDKAPATLTIKATAGLIYQDKGPAIFELYPALEPEGKSVSEAKVAPDRMEHEIKLTTTFTGLHKITLSDKNAMTRMVWPEEFAFTVQSTHEEPHTFQGRWNLYFYVPKGTKIVGGYAAGPGFMLDAKGAKIHTFADKPAYFHVAVPEGQDGKFWRMSQSVGERRLMTVPSVFSRAPRELLLPIEAAQKDGK